MAVVSKELVDKYESEGKRVIRIAPDWDVIWEDSKGLCYDFGEKGEFEIFSEDSDKSLIFSASLPGFASWLEELHAPMIEYAVGRKIPFDWENWNKRGLDYAYQLRKLLPENFVLFYEYAFEDELNRGKPAILIHSSSL